MSRKRRKSGSGRTITSEQQAKMQEGRKKAAIHKKRVSQLYKSGVVIHEDISKTERMLNGIKR